MKKIRVGIIGGGASGLMAAVSAARASDSGPETEIVILEKKEKIGKKILATGNGKCNLTNLSFSVENPGNYYRGSSPEILKGLFSRFSVQETLELFGQLGMLTMSRNGYVYPLSQQAATVLDTLRFELERLGVCVVTDCRISRIGRKQGGFEVETDGRVWRFDRLILACGSPAGEKKGEGMDGYRFAAAFGHRIIPPQPALVQLRCKGGVWKQLAGVRTDALITLTIGGKKKNNWQERGELQLTDYGISGIPVFQLSRFASCGLAQGRNAGVQIDFFPEFCGKEKEWKQLAARRLSEWQGRSMEMLFNGLVNKKIIQALLKENGLKPQDLLERENREQAGRVFELLRSFPAQVVEANPFSSAQVCAGGVPLEEVTPEMESRLCPGLFLAGELLDVDGKCGGYNLQWAWTSGFLAGKGAVARERGKGLAMQALTD